MQDVFEFVKCKQRILKLYKKNVSKTLMEKLLHMTVLVHYIIYKMVLGRAISGGLWLVNIIKPTT